MQAARVCGSAELFDERRPMMFRMLAFQNVEIIFVVLVDAFESIVIGAIGQFIGSKISEPASP